MGRLYDALTNSADGWTVKAAPPLPILDSLADLGKRIAEESRPVRTGRWDKATGRIVYEDESQDVTTITGPAVPRKVKASTVAPKPAPKPEPTPPKAEPKARDSKAKQRSKSPITEEVRRQIIALYASGKTVKQVGATLHIHSGRVSAVITEAGIMRKDGPQPNHRRDGKFTPEQVLAVYHSPEPWRVLTERFGMGRATIRRIKAGLAYSNVTGGKPQRAQRKTYEDIPVHLVGLPLPQQILAMHKAGSSVREISRVLHVYAKTINKVCGEAGVIRKPGRQKGQRSKRISSRMVLTDEQVLEIRRSTESAIALAERYHVSDTTISRARRRQSYKDVGAAD